MNSNNTGCDGNPPRTRGTIHPRFIFNLPRPLTPSPPSPPPPRPSLIPIPFCLSVQFTEADLICREHSKGGNRACATTVAGTGLAVWTENTPLLRFIEFSRGDSCLTRRLGSLAVHLGCLPFRLDGCDVTAMSSWPLVFSRFTHGISSRCVTNRASLLQHRHCGLLEQIIVQELCESRGGRPGLSVLTSLLVSVDVKLY